MNKEYIDKLAYIEIKERKILETRSKGKDVWYIPGGKREVGETDEQALVREVKEELNVDIQLNTISHYGTFEAQAHGKAEGVIVRVACYEAKYDGDPVPSAEIEELAWFDYARKEETSVVNQLIFDDLKKKDLID